MPTGNIKKATKHNQNKNHNQINNPNTKHKTLPATSQNRTHPLTFPYCVPQPNTTTLVNSRTNIEIRGAGHASSSPPANISSHFPSSSYNPQSAKSIVILEAKFKDLALTRPVFNYKWSVPRWNLQSVAKAHSQHKNKNLSVPRWTVLRWNHRICYDFLSTSTFRAAIPVDLL